MAPCHSTPLSPKAFSYTEDFEEGELVEAYSFGDGQFVLGMPITGQGPDITFSLYKTMDSLEIIIHDVDLVLWLRGIPSLRSCLQSDADTIYSNPIENFLPILPGLGANLVPCAISMDILLPRYPELSAKFSKYESRGLIFDALDLFVRHFLRQRSIFEAFGLENFRQRQVFTEIHVHDIREQSRNSRFAEDLDRLDELISEIDDMRELDESPVPVVIVVPASPIEQLKQGPGQTLHFIEASIKSNLKNAIAARKSCAVPEILAAATGLVDAETLCHAIHFYDQAHGAEIDGTDCTDGPLCAAAYAGEMEAVRQLVDYGAHVQRERSFSGTTPLEGAINGGNLEIVRYLVENGANVNDDRQPFRLCGKTPLAQAFNLGRADIASYLVSAGADLSPILSQIVTVD
ncbi:hypothetical protein KVR01_007362 [Diaporthe batatas]|uniref:uncharacterized protein n=1 Tax=Diaporthe batatas TaxID=748121 RepID=UPI001D03E4F2|nr:uncharacterized protein KVR01_007362 [Diaporthe batatas]KAG8162884.1 hypothetical protein KVR01_007362 [Diaporthe batatas]